MVEGKKAKDVDFSLRSVGLCGLGEMIAFIVIVALFGK